MPNSKLSLVFMGTPTFAVPALAALHEGGHAIVAVYTQPPRPAGRGQKETPSPVHQFALAHKLPVYTPESLKSLETQAEFAAHKADVAVVAAYGLLLPKPILTAYPMGCINVHPSLLPRWRGAAPIQRTIMASDRETGIVIMQMDAGLDTGDMLLVERFPIAPGTNAGALHDMLSHKSGALVLKTLEGLQNKTITPVKQPETGVTYAKKITKEEGRINWKEHATVIRNKILGLNPRPGAYFLYKDEAIKILEAEVENETPTAFQHCEPGTIIDERGRIIICGKGMLIPTFIQRPGKKPMSLFEMLRGHDIPTGTVLK
jgi:methionyl-tRNA formyltransferase